MAYFLYSIICIAAALFAVSDAGYYTPTRCCVKTEKCCAKFVKCGYVFKETKHKEPCDFKVCAVKCVKKPYKYSKKICTLKKVPVPCKYKPHIKYATHTAISTAVRDGHSDSNSDSGSDSGSDSDSDHGKKHKPYHPKPHPPKTCFKLKKKCYLKWFTHYKKVCKKVCKIVKAYQIIIKKFKYPKFCPKVHCYTLPPKCTGEKLEPYVAKKGIYIKTIKGKKVILGKKTGY